MPLITNNQYKLLLKNAYAELDLQRPCHRNDQTPIVRLHTADQTVNWLLTQIDLENPTNVLCLTDQRGRVDFCSIPLVEILGFRDASDQRLVNDLSFVGQEMIWVYAQASYKKINFSPDALYSVRYQHEANESQYDHCENNDW